MSEQDRIRLLINEKVTNGIDEGFKGVVDAGFIEQKIENTVEVSGATAEAIDLDISIEKLRGQISKTKVAAIITWILCVILFIARFCMKGVF